MAQLFPDILRSLVSAVMSALLLITLGQPKYKNRVLYSAVVIFILIDIVTSVCFYLYGNLTALAKFDIVLFILLASAMKLFFKDTIMQWIFNSLTVLNIFIVVMIVSFLIAERLPFYRYGNSLFRLIFFMGIILLFRRLRSVYRQVKHHWQMFSFVVFAILLNFIYYLIANDDIVKSFNEGAIPLLLLITLSAGIYICIFYSLQKMAAEYVLKEENLLIQNRHDILSLSMTSMRQELRLMEEIEQQNHIAHHDHRHFNTTILSLLRLGKTEAVIKALEEQIEIKPAAVKSYCENIAVNAAVGYYYGDTKENNINLITDLDIPEKLSINSLELAIVVSNLLENAIHACKKLPEESEKIIRFTAVYTGQQLLEMTNHYTGKIETDENGYPLSNEDGHGVGTKSVIAFVEKCGANIAYSVDDGIFSVRISV